MSQAIPYAQKKPSAFKMLQAMVGIGIGCALMIVLIYEGTKPLIKVNKAEALEAAIFRVVPGAERSQAFVYEEGKGFSPVEGQTAEGEVVYATYDTQGKLAGIGLTGAGQGYADIIRILYGYDPQEEEVVGFYVLESKETPGLGDKIEKDPVFLANFEAMDVSLEGDKLRNPVVTVKSGEKEHPWQVDGITGATISSRAIGNILDESVEKWAPRLKGNLEDFKSEK